MCCHGSCFLTPRVGQGPAVIFFLLSSLFFLCFFFFPCFGSRSRFFFWGVGEEKGTVAEVCVTRGVCVRAPIPRRDPEEVSWPQVNAEDTTHRCYPKKGSDSL